MAGARFPIYIPSKGRAESRLTARCLRNMGVPYFIVVEEAEADEYRAVIEGGEVLVLDPAYQREYDACVELPEGASRGSGPARNFIWDHAQAAGWDWHWTVDDNIRNFYRFHDGEKIRFGDGTCFAMMEDFTLRYANVAMAGPNYEYFAPRHQRTRPFVANTRIFSCNLIQTGLPYRWRGRYNEDADLSIRMLKDGWATILFNAVLADKISTQVMTGGNTDEIYANGTVDKSLMLVRLHPDVVRPAWRFGRAHHYADYRRFRKTRLIRREEVVIPEGEGPYGLRLTERDPTLGRRR